MSKQEIDKSYFLTFCIEQFKQSRGIVNQTFENLMKLQAQGLLERVGSRKKGYWKVKQSNETFWLCKIQ